MYTKTKIQHADNFSDAIQIKVMFTFEYIYVQLVYQLLVFLS